MTKASCTKVCALLVLVFALSASAAEDQVISGMAEKGTHGLVNILTGWFEVPMQVYKGYNKGIAAVEAPAASRSLGTVAGFFRGISHAVGRTGWGLVQLGGFWTSNPTSNEHLMSLLDDEYAWQNGDRKEMYSDFNNNLNRVGTRFERGVRNLVGSITEFPGQIRKADAEKRVYVGIPKGIWFTGSRFVYGVSDMLLVLVPGPGENLGVPYDEVDGWDALQGDYYSNISQKK